MAGTLIDSSATVPIAGDEDVIVEPGQPWPAPYRGSRYSLVDSRRRDGTVLQWKYNDQVVHVEPPTGILDRLQNLGKSSGSGKGSIRITAGGEILTKIHSSQYVNAGEAPVDSGWIPVYLGSLEDDLGFDINIDPTPKAGEVGIWTGFPFNHGERWSVSFDDQLIWKWQDYRFQSAFDHSELVETYQKYRTTAGRLYVNEFGHVFINVPRDEMPESTKDELTRIFNEWKQRAERENDTAAQRLVTRRLKVTGDGNPEDGHLPVYLGHLNQFDNGTIPRPVVDDEAYYVAAARGEELSS